MVEHIGYNRCRNTPPSYMPSPTRRTDSDTPIATVRQTAFYIILRELPTRRMTFNDPTQKWQPAALVFSRSLLAISSTNLTLFSKFFSSFPHGTCSLSVSRQYLALDETYHPFRAAIPNNSTRWTRIVRDRLQVINGILTLADAFFQRTYTWAIADHVSLGYNSWTRLGSRFSYWALPASLAVTEGILVSFFSSPY